MNIDWGKAEPGEKMAQFTAECYVEEMGLVPGKGIG
jgi:hypothetical protein